MFCQSSAMYGMIHQDQRVLLLAAGRGLVLAT